MGDVALEVGLGDGQNFHRQDGEGHRLQAMAQSRTATIELVRVGGALSDTAVPLCIPLSTSVSLVPPIFLGSQSMGKEKTRAKLNT